MDIKKKWWNNITHLEEIRKGLTKYITEGNYQGKEEPLALLREVEERIDKIRKRL